MSDDLPRSRRLRAIVIAVEGPGFSYTQAETLKDLVGFG
jgi:hypothetical protein